MEWPGWTKVLILSIGFLSMLFFTIRDLAPVLTDYYDSDRNTAVQVAVVANSTLMKPPVISICVPYVPLALQKVVEGLQKNESTCAECQALTEKSWNVWTDMTSITREKLSRKFVSKVFENDSNVLHVNNSDWNLPIVDAVFEYFALVGRADDILYMGANGTRNLSHGFEDFYPEKAKIDTVYGHLLFFICHYIRFSLHHQNWTSSPKSEEYCAEHLTETLVEISSYKFCFYLPTDLGNLVLTVNSAGGYQYDEEGRDVFVPENATTWPSLDPHIAIGYYRSIYEKSGPENIYVRDSDGMEANGEMTVIYYSIAFSVLEYRNRACYLEQSQLHCVLTCKVQMFADLCHCIPFFQKSLLRPQRNGYDHLPYCTATSYKRCKAIYDTKIETPCINQCKNPCQYASYKWLVEPTYPSGLQGWHVVTRWTGQEEPPRFVQFTLIPKHTPEILISQIGGIAGIYLGISGLSIFGLLVWAVESSRKWWRLKNNLGNGNAIQLTESHWKSQHGSGAAYNIESGEIHGKEDLIILIKQMQTDYHNRMAKLEETVSGLADKMRHERNYK